MGLPHRQQTVTGRRRQGLNLTPEQRATQALFGDPDYKVRSPNNEFILRGEWITWTALVERFREQEKQNA